jgi:hypothetical protein
MLEKSATHDVDTVPTLFALADKCARAAEGRAWHSAPQIGAAQSGGSGAVPRDGKKKKKKDRDYQKSWSTTLVIAAAIIAAATGAGATTTNAHGRRGVTTIHALCTPTVATAPRSVARSLTLRSVSASSASSLPRTTLHLIADLAKKRPTTARWPRLNGTLGISHPRET